MNGSMVVKWGKVRESREEGKGREGRRKRKVLEWRGNGRERKQKERKKELRRQGREGR